MKLLIKILIVICFISSKTNADFFEIFGNQNLNKQNESLNALSNINELINAQIGLQVIQAAKNQDCEPAYRIRQNAIKGKAFDQFLLSDLILQGLCFEQSNSNAIKWLERSSDNGYPSASFDLGYHYLNGKITQQNIPRSIQLLKKADKDNDVRSSYILGKIYFEGKYLPKNFKTSIKWFKRGAELGDEKSALFLIQIYLDTKNPFYNFEQSIILAKDFAERGSHVFQALASDLITQKLLNDNIQDLESFAEPYMWALLAQTSNETNIRKSANEKVNMFEEVLPNDIKAYTQLLASNWKPTNKNISSESIQKINLEDLPKIDDNMADSLSQENALKFIIAKGMMDKDVLFEAVKTDNLGLLKVFLKAGASIDTRNHYGASLLYFASDWGSIKIAKYLIKNGANLNLQNIRSGATALTRAISHDEKEIIKSLIDAGVNCNDLGQNDPYAPSSPILYAVGGNDANLVEELINCGADTNAPLMHGNNLVHFAVKNTSNPKILKILISNGLNINAKNNYGVTPLINLFEAYDYNILEILIKNGADPNFFSNISPLILAILEGDLDAVVLLVENGANISFEYNLNKDNVPYLFDENETRIFLNGGNALHYAVYRGEILISRYLSEMMGLKRFKSLKNGEDLKSFAQISKNKNIINEDFLDN